MKYSKDKLINVSVKKLKKMGFVNITKENLFKDEVYIYHFKAFMNALSGQYEDLDVAIKKLFSLIDKKNE
jgi:hypothetical protein